MTANPREILEQHLDQRNLEALLAIPLPAVHAFVADAITLCKPKAVFVCTDAQEDHDYTRRLAVDDGSERPLAMHGHTIHFDGYRDQARDKANTKYLVPEGVDLGKQINAVAKEKGLPEVRGYLDGAMAASGGIMLVCFHCLGPTDSVFSVPVMQVTDSSYVAHSLSLLYRGGYDYFKTLEPSDTFFRVLHSQGEQEQAPNGSPVSKHVDKRRVYIDLDEILVYSVNTQYAGNTVGLKKLSLRLAIRQAAKEGWLAEHMFVTGVPGPHGRWTYFAGAFPSACGKTSTAMIPGHKIVGDDLAYLRKIGGCVRAANSESGIFGIIRDVNPDDDPAIYKALTTPHEAIFSNVLVRDGVPYWMGMGKDLPASGVNHWGDWQDGMADDTDRAITASHPNARYTVRMDDLENCDHAYHDPDGVELGAVVYGGRDSDTHVPITQAFDWTHGVITMGASLESETTAATLGAEGQRKFNVMSNLDFLSMSVGEYLDIYLRFAKGVQVMPKVFGVNYFLKGEDGRYITGMLDKKVWMLWAERRVHGDVGALRGPTGYIPIYEDLLELFHNALGRDYTVEDYIQQFTIRIPKLLAKNERIVALYQHDVPDAPQVFYRVMAAQRERLLALQRHQGDNVTPFDL
ncbi:phosphoenolpyruvate carboxykinase (GTP) [Planctomycetota bacterium]